MHVFLSFGTPDIQAADCFLQRLFYHWAKSKGEVNKSCCSCASARVVEMLYVVVDTVTGGRRISLIQRERRGELEKERSKSESCCVFINHDHTNRNGRRTFVPSTTVEHCCLHIASERKLVLVLSIIEPLLSTTCSLQEPSWVVDVDPLLSRKCRVSTPFRARSTAAQMRWASSTGGWLWPRRYPVAPSALSCCSWGGPRC